MVILVSSFVSEGILISFSLLSSVGFNSSFFSEGISFSFSIVSILISIFSVGWGEGISFYFSFLLILISVSV